MAVCDAKYTFTAISIGSYGSQSDGGIFRISPFGQALLSNQLPLPPDKPLCSESQPFPHYFVGDAAFPLRRNIMRPYAGTNLDRSKRIFNYRLSRARRVIENSFGILSARWRILLRTMECSPENCEKIVLACIALHNFIMLNDHQRWYCPDNYTDREGADNVVHQGDWRRDINDSRGAFRTVTTFARRGPAEAFQLRERLAHHFLNAGAVSFQNGIYHTPQRN
ncbi:PREDICTED: putative nuclease HARBI1 [Rhagoletis zephyria]|uniref:putative nuclease HARBI1 n=1 Tax=Rhagoletis zephyria TaxID=28612 RepID=UPI00081166DD|nr:PREDICTED: putative nuclease HARBI1 [Rhagoletis zephyria]